MMMRRKFLLPHASLLWLAIAAALLPGSGGVLAQETGAQAQQEVKSFAGTWHWLRNGEPFATMILVRNGDRYSGTVTLSRISLAEDGSLDMADPVPGAAPSEISEATVSGSVLHIKTKDGFAFAATLTDSTHATIKPDNAPSNMKPIPAQKVE